MNFLPGLLAALVILTMLGCPSDANMQSPTAETCESVATRCRLDTGGVGICSFDNESKLMCMPQH